MPSRGCAPWMKVYLRLLGFFVFDAIIRARRRPKKFAYFLNIQFVTSGSNNLRCEYLTKVNLC